MRDMKRIPRKPKPHGTFKDAILAMPNVGRDSDFRRPKDKPRKVRL